MKKQPRTLSVLLTVVMLLSILSPPSWAAEEQTDESADVQTLTLPLIEEGDEAPEPQGYGVSLLDLEANKENTFYAYQGVGEIYLNGQVYILDSDGNHLSTAPESNGIIQLIDGDGNAVASSDAISCYYTNHYEEDDDGNSVEIREYYFSYRSIEDTTAIPAGTYKLQLVAGNTTYACEGSVEIVSSNCLLINSAYTSDFYAGEDSFEIQLQVYGFETDDELNDMSFSLMNGETVVAKSTGTYRDISVNNSSDYGTYWYLYTKMDVVEGQSIATGTSYSLTIGYSGSKTLVDGVGAVTKSAYTPSPEIDDFAVVNAQTGKVSVSLKYLTSGTSYTVTISDDSDQTNVYGKGSVTAEGSTATVELQLSKDGYTVPLSSYGYRFYVELTYYADGEYWPSSNSGYFSNPYYDLHDEHVYFYPYYVKPTTTSLPFEIEFYNGCSAWKGSGDVLYMRDSSGNEVGRCDALTLTYEDSYGYIEGTLSVTGSLTANKTYYLWLNGTQFDTVYVASDMRISSYDLPMVNYSKKIFYMNLGLFAVDAYVFNSSGTGTIVFKNGDTDVLSSKDITGTAVDTDILNYQYRFTSEEFKALTSGTAYTIVFRDSSGSEKQISSYTYTYDTEVAEPDFTDSSDVYFSWYHLEPGNQSVNAEVYMYYSHGVRNITESSLEALKKITLSNGTDTFSVTGYTGSWDSDYDYYNLTLTLDKTLTAGDYTAYLDGEEFYDFTVETTETDTTPGIYYIDTGMYYIRGKNLPSGSTYTGKLYSGYTCLTETPFTLTLDSGTDSTWQYLYFDGSVISSLAAGTYEMRIYRDGKLLGSEDFDITKTDTPIVTVNDSDGDYSDGGDPVMHSTGVKIVCSNAGSYGYMRYAETKDALASGSFGLSSRTYLYTFTGDDGTRTLYVELSKTGKDGDSENLVYSFDLVLCTAKDYGLQVPESIQGIQDLYSYYTITATTKIRATDLWVSFYDADGKHASQQMSYTGETDDGLYKYSLSFYPSTGSFYDSKSYGGRFYYKNTQSIKVFTTDKSEKNNSKETYDGNIMGTPVERVLIFGDPDSVILPQFSDSSYLTINTNSYELYGYASAGSTVTVTEDGSEDALATATADDNGYFTVSLSDLSDKRHTLTVADSSGTVESKTVYLTVDTTAPVLSSVTFTFLENNAAVLHWECSDTDVERFNIYKDGTYLGYADSSDTSYNVAASEDDGSKFTIEAVDYAGNKSTRVISTSDSEPPTAATDLTVTGVTTGSVSLSWTAGTDNRGVAGYDVYKDGEKVTELTGPETTYTVNNLEQGTTYSFTVQTRDKAGNTSESSESVSATTAKLIVSDTLESGYTVADDSTSLSIPFEVTASSDTEGYTPVISDVTLQYRNAGDSSGEWTDGGLTAEKDSSSASCLWAAPVDSGSLPASYEVRTAVTDGNGAASYSETKTVTISEGRVSVTVKDTTDESLISGATVSLYKDGEFITSAKTGTNGVAKLGVSDGSYSVIAEADDYQPRNLANMTVTDSKRSFTVYMNKEDVLNVEATVEEMTYDEIVAAGIDPDAEGNEHVYQATVVLEFAEITYVYNEDGEVVAGDAVSYNGGVIYPAAKDIFLIIPTETTWLKEMFDVQLLVTNTSAVENMKECSATLTLPDGLSLADMNGGAQSATASLGTILPKTAATHHWYVRGDAKGKYTLSGNVTATRSSDDFEEALSVPFTTQDPVTVLAGDAMKLTITAEKTAVTGQPYNMRFELQNVSSKSLYNVNFDVFGGIFREAYSITDLLASYDLKGPFKDDADNSVYKNGFTLSADEFKPTEALSGNFTITFAEGLDKEDDIQYMLKKVFLFTGAGSTTEIPVEIKLVDSLSDHIHTYDDGVVTKAATCTESGEMTYTCSDTDCTDKTLVVEIPALGHDMSDWSITTAATCTAAGTAESKCTRDGCTCSETKTLAALGHEFSDEWTTDTEPTCTEAGSKSHKCTRCDETESEVIPATGHTVVTDAAVEPACTETGLTEGSHCSVCGIVLTAQEIVAATGHTAVANAAVAATCTTEGKTEGSHCSVCGTVLTAQETIAALGHNWGEWTITTHPTESAEGVETRTCARCSATETQTVPKLTKQSVEWPVNIGETVTYTYGDTDSIRTTAENSSTDGGSITYSSSDENVATVDEKGIVTIKNAGTATITAAAAAVEDKYAKTEISYKLVINKAALTVTANDKTIAYGDAPAYDGYTCEGFKNGDAAGVLSGTPVYDCAYEQYGKAGEYEVSISGLSAANYDITYVPGKLTVNKATAYSIALENLKQYTVNLSPVTAAITPEDSSAVISIEYEVDGAWSTEMPSEAGEYKVRASLVSSDNIEPDSAETAEGTLVIEKGAVIEIGGDTVGVDVDVEGNEAVVTVPEDKLAEIRNDSGDASLDLGALEDIKDITLPGDLIETLADGDGSTTIKSEDASITMDNEVMETIADAVTSGEDKITLRMTEVKAEDMNEAQKAALNSLAISPAIVELSLIVTHPDGTTTTLSELNGKVQVSVPYTVPEGQAGQNAVACYISADGYITYIRAAYKNNAITFTTDHFSHYAVGLSENYMLVVNDGSGSGLYAEGDTVTIKADSKSGYSFNGWTVTEGSITLADSSAAETTFTMPAGSVELTADYKQSSSNNSGGSGGSATTYSVTAETAENGTVSVSSSSAAKGDTVTVTATPADGYVIDQVTATDKSGNVVELTDIGNGEYTFTMPAAAVTVKATFSNKSGSGSDEGFFVDVADSAYYYDAVKWAVDNGITSGTTATTFSPDAGCTRAQMVTFLWRAAGSPEPSATSSAFTDISADGYYYKAVMWAIEKGITNGTSATTFSPDRTVTRAQTVAFLWRYAGSPAAEGTNPFTDVAADAYYADAVLWASLNGVTTGTSATTFSPDNDCTRAQIVTFMERYMNK